MSNENGNYTINLYHLVQICVSNFRISTLYYQIHSALDIRKMGDLIRCLLARE